MQPLANRSIAKITFAVFIAIVAWFAIILQFFLKTGSDINFFSFFTIECNLLIAISLSFYVLFPAFSLGRFFTKVSVQSAITLYIFIVALVYNTVLRGILVLNGWSWVVDNLLHVVVPILYLLYYLVYIPKGHLKWKDGIYWMYFPLAYLMYSLIRGSVVNWYPYPFLNVAIFGYPKVLLNVAIIIVAFFIGALALIAFNRSVKKEDDIA